MRQILIKLLALTAILSSALIGSNNADACTGISLRAKDGSYVIGRTMEWGTFPMPSRLIIVPRGHTHTAITPSGDPGIELKAKYGYAGIAVLEDNFMAEGMNEQGMVVELFYFPGYGEHMPYDRAKNKSTITDAQFLDWVLCNFKTVEEMEAALHKIRFVTYGKGFESAHYRIADANGRDVVVEYYGGKFHVHENIVGVITNSPSFDWHVTNLNNYVNCFAGIRKPRKINDQLTIKSFGMGSASLGLPGDLTPPSRFVRAAFYVATANPQPTGWRTVKQVFQILNNFDLPVGAEFDNREELPDMLSATQWTTATDIRARKFYYRTEWNYMIRCLDFNQIDFGSVEFQTIPLDKEEEYPVEMIHVGTRCAVGNRFIQSNDHSKLN